MLSAASRTHAKLSGRPFGWGFRALLAVFMLAALTTARRWLRLVRRARVSASPSKSPRAAAAIWYERMIRTLARKGWRKLPAQTPTEFLTLIDDAILKSQVAKFTTLYESARFGGSAKDAVSLAQLYEELSCPGLGNNTTKPNPSE
jgi:hypothetical protein